MSRTYLIRIDNFATTPGLVLAINNPADSGARIEIRCVENTHADTIATNTYSLRRYSGLASGGDVLPLEPGDDSARVMRRDGLDSPPEFEVRTGSFTTGGTLLYDEAFTLISREGEDASCHDANEEPLIVRPGESAVLFLVQSDMDTSSVAVEVREVDAIPGIAPATAPFVRLIGEAFSLSGALPATHWTTDAANGGTAIRGGGELIIATNTTADGSVNVESTRVARFLTGAVHEFSATLRLTAGAADNVRAWGVMTEDEGYGFKLDGTTMGLFSRTGGVDTFVQENSWSVDAFVVGTDVREWTIRYDLNRADFFVDGVLRHSLPAAAGGPRIAEHDLPIRFENTNSNGSTTNHEMRLIGTSIVRHGPHRSAPRYYHFDGSAQAVTLKEGAGTLGELLITKAGTGGSSILIYDGLDATGALIADVNGDALAALLFGLEFGVGLHVVASANSGKSTVIFD